MGQTFRYSLQRSIPVLFGYLPLGLAYGILMQETGLGVPWVLSCCAFVYTGALQFLMVSFFVGGFSYLAIAILAMSLSSRHLFYGLSFIERFRKYGLSRWFLIFTLTDENYSLHCAYKPEEGVNEKWAHIITSALTWFYWTSFSVLGALIGSLITFNTEGMDFALTALFVTILIDQIRDARNVYPPIIAAVSGIVSLLIFGASNFILPALILTVAGLFLLQNQIKAYLPVKEDNK